MTHTQIRQCRHNLQLPHPPPPPRSPGAAQSGCLSATLESESDSHLVESDSVTPRTVACQAPLSMEFSKQEYWSGLPFPSPGNLSNPEIKPGSLCIAGSFFTTRWYVFVTLKEKTAESRMDSPPLLEYPQVAWHQCCLHPTALHEFLQVSHGTYPIRDPQVPFKIA